MTNEQVMRQNDIEAMRKELLKFNYLMRLSKIDELYFDEKITNKEHDEMKQWWKESAY